MRYIATIETDEFEDFEFFEDGNGKYLHGIDAGSVNGEWIPLYFTECEQEPKIDVLDKIRAEIEAEYQENDATRCEEYDDGYCLGLQTALNIINKYRKEQE